MKLRTQITVLGVGTAALVVGLAAVPLTLLLHNNAYDEAQQRATYAAQSTADYITAGPEDRAQLSSYLHRLNRRTSTPVTVVAAGDAQVGSPIDGARLNLALRTPEPALGDDDADNLGAVSRAYVTTADDVRIVQIFCRTGAGPARVVAVVDGGSAAATIRRQNLALGGTAAALLALAWIAADLVGRRIVRPLRRTEETAKALSDGDLTARAPESGPPEVARVAAELNALAARIDELLRMERENAADLSHRLRTPLTAVRLTVEALPDSPTRTELEHHVSGLERSLTQLIRAARRGDREGLHPHCDACAVTRERMAFWQPLVEDQLRSWELSTPSSPAPVRLVADDLAGTLDALIENAVAHTPEGTPLAVRVLREGDDWLVEVLDQGPGIPSSALERGRSDRGSSGLGLDIARATAEAAGGRLELVDDGRWRGVRLRLR